MLLSPVPVVRAARRDRVPYGGQAGPDYPADPEAAVGRGVGRLPVHARQPEGTVRGTLVSTPRVPAVVQRRAGHRDPPVRRRRTGSTRSRRRDGTTASRRWVLIDRSRPIEVHVRRSSAPRGSKATRSRARCWRTVSTSCVGRRSWAGPAGSSRPGVEESSAFVEVLEPWFEPIVAGDDGQPG